LQFFKDGANGMVVQTGQAHIAVLIKNRVGAEVDVVGGELFYEATEDVGLDKRRYLVAKCELAKNLLHVLGETIKVGLEISLELLLFRASAQVAKSKPPFLISNRKERDLELLKYAV
jgi:hypothetical protein